MDASSITAMASVSASPSAPAINPNQGPAAAKKSGEDFEAFFMSQVFENMFAGLGADPMFGGGQGENVYRSLLTQEYSKVAAKNGSTGIAASVTREILRMQETANQKV
jgi:Rod binding domain-containing protein